MIQHKAFTIVELLIVIVIIAILSTLTIVAYNGITQRATEVTLQSDLRNGANKLGVYRAENNSYPNPSLPSDINATSGNTFSYQSNGAQFCLEVVSGNPNIPFYHISDSAPITQGSCPVIVVSAGDYIQDVTAANCPSTRTRVVDARDDHTYWVQELADGNCWMLTNLAYAGGGTNTYGDVQTLSNGTGLTESYTTPYYYVVPSTTNYELEPDDPSTSTNGTGQYGYLYNWCGAMAGQVTAACANATTPSVDTAVSVCPSGWRLPNGNGMEFAALNNAVNSGSTSTDAGLLSTWLGQLSGSWVNVGTGFVSQDIIAAYWTSSIQSSTQADIFMHYSDTVEPDDFNIKIQGLAARCVTN